MFINVFLISGIIRTTFTKYDTIFWCPLLWGLLSPSLVPKGKHSFFLVWQIRIPASDAINWASALRWPSHIVVLKDESASACAKEEERDCKGTFLQPQLLLGNLCALIYPHWIFSAPCDLRQVCLFFLSFSVEPFPWFGPLHLREKRDPNTKSLGLKGWICSFPGSGRSEY